MSPATPLALVFILAALLVAAGVAMALTPLAGRLAARAGAIDRPGAPRRVHERPIPRAGGLAVTAAFVAVGIGALLLNEVIGAVPPLRAIPVGHLAVLFGGALLAAAIGLVDDRHQLRAHWQLLAQIGLACVAVVAGVSIDFINDPLGGGIIRFAAPLAAAFTIIWIVGMINSINFIDGLDGLSTGVALIAAFTLGLISLTVPINQPFVALLCAVLVGSLAGFLPSNFHPARIFVGTTGVYVMGYALAVLSIIGVAKVAVALLVLGVPIIDTFWIIVRRLLVGRSPFTPDRGHFHHKLLDLGLGHRSAVLLIYGLCLVLAVLSLLLSGTGPLYAFLGVVVAGGLLLYAIDRRATEALRSSTYDTAQTEG